MHLRSLEGIWSFVRRAFSFSWRGPPLRRTCIEDNSIEQRRLRILEALREKPGATVREIISAAKLHYCATTVYRDLQVMIGRGAVRRIGRHKRGHLYFLVEDTML